MLASMPFLPPDAHGPAIYGLVGGCGAFVTGWLVSGLAGLGSARGRSA
jgi:hypothetical protein